MIVDVAVPYRVSQSFHYLIDPEVAEKISLGSIVQVPIGKRSTFGFVLGFPEKSGVPAAKLRPIEEVLVHEALFDAPMLKFLIWISDYYCHPLGEVIAAAIPRSAWDRKTPKRPRKTSSSDPLQGLVPSNPERPVLTEEQSFALARILDPEERRPVLLHGVTGSGKTEVYMNALEAVIGRDKGAIILVPEIALTPQLLGRFSTRFPGQVAVLHSDLTDKEKSEQWNRLREGAARVVIGARSAVFAPVKNLGLIVVDEEHESSFKQEDSLRYHARDVAVVRGQFEGAKVVLGSATPSLESFANAQNGKYLHVTLKNRVASKGMPTTHFVDVKSKDDLVSPKMPWLSKFLLQKIEEKLQRGEQSLLYLNRLGFAHFLFCEDCGHTWRCKNCDVALTYYKDPPSLRCHYCGDWKQAPSICEGCNGNKLQAVGFGTEQVERQLAQVLPHARIARMDRSRIKNRKDLEAILNSIAGREVDIVIGTQMIAKGHDFPGIALVGILLADASLNLPDFRANERTFQIVTQVSGRAGRADVPGEVVIQTVNPEHPVLRAAAENRAIDFYRFEMETRRAFGFPPYQRLAMLRFQHTNETKVSQFAEDVVATVKRVVDKEGNRSQLIGPASMPLSRLKNQYRWHCMVKSESVPAMQWVLRVAQEYVATKKSTVQFAVDVDPNNAL